MAMICHKFLPYVVVSAPKPVVDAVMRAFETGIFDVSASIWRTLALQSQLLLAKQSESQLQVGENWHKFTVQTYLLTFIKILAIIMFPEVLRMRWGAGACSCRMRVYFTQM